MPTSTSRLDLLQPIGSDAVSELRIAITANATGLDGAVIVTQGTVSGRPTNGSYVGQTYYATDTGLWYFWTGSAWQTVMLAGALSEGTVSSRALERTWGRPITRQTSRLGMSGPVPLGGLFW
jgi:hypothetical protein